MMKSRDLSPTTLQKIQNELQIPSLQIHLFESAGANTDGYRLNLRTFARDQLQNSSVAPLSPPELAQLLDLSQVPTLKLVRLSLSHCAQIGGLAFAAATDCAGLGLDLETQDRVSERVARRTVRSEQPEFAESPSGTHLWIAKESSYKCLRNLNQPEVISQFIIENWRILAPDLWAFSFRTTHQQSGQGAVCATADLLVAISRPQVCRPISK